VEELAVAYTIQQPMVDEIIIGVETTKQLKDNLDLFTKNYSSGIVAEINKIKVAESNLLYPKNWN
jgi:aryl-alcohol dehydrogenase-like predicted oxidoreductase